MRRKVPSSQEEREGTFAAIEITFFSPISVTQCDTEINAEKCDVWGKKGLTHISMFDKRSLTGL